MAALLSGSEIEELRRDTPGCRSGGVHLDHAGSSLPPQSVLDTQHRYLDREALIGGYGAGAEAAEQVDGVYRSIASLVGARPHEIARTEHATEAWNRAFWSIPMRPGQRIITHDHDYGANAVAMLHAAATRGITIERIPSDAAGQIDLEALARALERPDEVALVSLAWIPTNGGLVNPAAAVGELTRAAGVIYLLDACQAVGQLVIDVEAIGCDFLSATGRKFIRGPRGTGFLFAREDVLDRVVPAQPDHHAASWTEIDRYEWKAGAARFEQWEFAYANWLGLGAAIDVALAIGLDRIQATVSDRARDLRTRLAGIGLTVHDEGVAKCGIVTTSHPSIPSEELSRRLAVDGVRTSVTLADSSRTDVERRDLPPMLRLSVHCTTTTDELDQTIEALLQITSQ